MKIVSFRVFFAVIVVFIIGCNKNPTDEEIYHEIDICYESLDRSAEDVEQDITIPVEEILASLELAKTISSVSSRDHAIITLEISQKFNVEEAIEKIKNELSQKSTLLPLGMPNPIIAHITDTSEPIKLCEQTPNKTM